MTAALDGSLRWLDRASTLLLAAGVAAIVALLTGGVAGQRLLVERSDSMRPVLTAGDLLVTKRAPAASIRRGDIVTFSDRARGGRLITHRVVAIDAGARSIVFHTRGDANTASESWAVARSATVARLRARAPQVGRALALAGRIPLAPVIVLAAILCGYLALSRRRR